MNTRLTARDRGLIKGAIRRAFARSALHDQVLAAAAIDHYDEKRPRCKKWVYCAQCGQVFPKWCATVDHLSPVVPVDTTFEEMSLDFLLDRMWCDIVGLQVLCLQCHCEKTRLETQQRKAFKNERKERKAAASPNP